MAPNIPLLRGTLDLLILRALSAGPRHGYGIAEWLDASTDGTLTLEEGSLYPALQRLERKGWVSATWGRSENNRRARFYALTPKGEAQLERELSEWQSYTEAMAKALGQEPA